MKQCKHALLLDSHLMPTNINKLVDPKHIDCQCEDMDLDELELISFRTCIGEKGWDIFCSRYETGDIDD